MNTRSTQRRSQLRVALVVLGLALAAGCAKQPEEQPAVAATGFATPDEAVGAFVAALEKYDLGQLQILLGPGSEALFESGDAVQDAGDRAEFLAAYAAKHALVDDGPDRKNLVVGEQDWPMPIPLVQRDGKWLFDGEAGVDELIYRRVGANELGAIAVSRGFVGAQLEYASEGRDGDPPGIYALKLVSDEGLHNGLYWPTADDEPPSPAGPFVAAAAGEGYRRVEGERTPYHGYYYRLLYAQGPNANGGAREYFKDGLLTEGFALVAWPADYGSSGVMTFIVNADGVVFQKDLGEETATVVESIQAFDPDSSWTAVVEPEEAAD
jgi:Protein of unknown function (DUF2950)